MSWQDRVPEVQRRFEALTEALADPAVLESRERYTATAREHAERAPVVGAGARGRRTRARGEAARGVVGAGGDRGLGGLAGGELGGLGAGGARLGAELRRLLVPKDPLADRAAVVE